MLRHQNTFVSCHILKLVSEPTNQYFLGREREREGDDRWLYRFFTRLRNIFLGFLILIFLSKLAKTQDIGQYLTAFGTFLWLLVVCKNLHLIVISPTINTFTLDLFTVKNENKSSDAALIIALIYSKCALEEKKKRNNTN